MVNVSPALDISNNIEEPCTILWRKRISLPIQICKLDPCLVAVSIFEEKKRTERGQENKVKKQ
jgi:hypothetical protein